MYKGTTPTHTFAIDIDTSIIKTIKITYAQNGKEVLTKRTKDCTLGDGVIQVRLTQEETFLFAGDALFTIQMRVLTMSGDALTSEPMMVRSVECLDNEVLE